MKWLDCIPFPSFTSSSWWVHVGLISLICADGDKRKESDTSDGGDLFGVAGDISPTVEENGKEAICQYENVAGS